MESSKDFASQIDADELLEIETGVRSDQFDTAIGSVAVAKHHVGKFGFDKDNDRQAIDTPDGLTYSA